MATQTAKAVLPAGTVVHVGGIPFRVLSDVEVEGKEWNFSLVKDEIGMPFFKGFPEV